MDPILLELFILPPFCDLPSISGSCIAALSLCTVAVPSSTLRVIETSDLTLAPPALRRGKHWYRGFTAIKHFLDREWDIDPALSPEQKAEAVAWESLVQDIGESLAVPTPLPPSFVRILIGQWTTLFVSRENYLGVTRREFSRSLRFPHNFTLPTELRAYAVRRCEDIGFTETLDDEEPPHAQDSFGETWITKRINWDQRAHLVKVKSPLSWCFSGLALTVGSYIPLPANSIPRYQISSLRPQRKHHSSLAG
jgi:Outer mitochondrial membrane transport complex protein